MSSAVDNRHNRNLRSLIPNPSSMSTLGELCNAIGGRLCSRRHARRRRPMRRWGRSQSDSRKIEPGDVFWALRGPNHEGEQFVGEAFRRGAAGAVVGQETSPVPDVPLGRSRRRHAPGAARLGAVEAAPIHRHGDRRDRQRRQDHHAADDPHRAAIAASRHGQPAKLQQPLRRALEHDGDRAGPRLRRAGVGREPAGRDRRAGRVVAGRRSA